MYSDLCALCSPGRSVNFIDCSNPDCVWYDPTDPESSFPLVEVNGILLSEARFRCDPVAAYDGYDHGHPEELYLD